MHGEAGPMAKMPQVGSSQQGVKRVGKQRRELPIIWRRTSRPSYRPRTEMPSLNHALSPNRNAIPLLVIRRHRRLRSRYRVFFALMMICQQLSCLLVGHIDVLIDHKYLLILMIMKGLSDPISE